MTQAELPRLRIPAPGAAWGPRTRGGHRGCAGRSTQGGRTQESQVGRGHASKARGTSTRGGARRTAARREAHAQKAHAASSVLPPPPRVIYGGSAKPCKISGWEDVGWPAGGRAKRTAPRTLVRVHRCQDPAWGARVPVAILVPSLLPSALSTPVRAAPSPALRRPRRALPEGPAAAAALALPAGPAEAACALCQHAPREPVRADCGHRFCRACVVRFWAEEDGPFPCPECADDCWQRAVEPGRPPLSRRLLALEEAAAAPARDGPASEAALQLLCRADGGPLCAACRMAAGPEPPEWEPRWRKALRGKENKGSVEIMRKDLNDARDLHGQAESAAAVWKGHVMDRRKKALTDYKKLRAFFAEEEERFLQEVEKEEGSPEAEDADPVERFRSLLQAVSDLERRHHDLGLSMLLQ
ncbi:E3 ubiquitin-protein ligase RNF187 [Diceros bicornis minor]|uniref:E3 ubiquitin-protein ligase RNF187 n=1 Tax=Diceros bicornis minor TaxID=77932 RepID=UPI0026ED5BED|nr:E3 ubiquitin-protein ligase RNF187 [Diceros bicornis minor]